VCLAEKDGRIVYLNHDDEMRDEFMNSSVLQLAYSLLAFRSAVQSAIDVGGDNAYLDSRIPNEVVERFIGEMDRIDPEAIKAERFWLRSILGDGV
ncbi:MAG TPA: SUKH-4 family immunity protein, partial [Opitutaceae bacterium]